MTNLNNQSLLDQTLQQHSELDLSLDILTEAQQKGGGGCSDVFQCKLSASWRPRTDDNIINLLNLMTGNYNSTFEPGNAGTPVTSDGVIVAVKRLRFWGRTDQRLEKEVCRELKIWASLSHPNILPLLGYVPKWTGVWFPSLVSPWMENGSLRSYYLRGQDFDSTEMTKGIATGLSYLHSRDIVHADLKCDNILLSPTIQPLLTDFGLSRRIIATFSVTTSKGGTLRWTAPELIKEEVERANKQTDIWALGMTILELTTKDLPYNSCNTEFAIKGCILRGELPQLPESMDGCTAEERHLWSIYPDCCQSDPSRRPNMQSIHSRLFETHDPSLPNNSSSPI